MEIVNLYSHFQLRMVTTFKFFWPWGKESLYFIPFIHFSFHSLVISLQSSLHHLLFVAQEGKNMVLPLFVVVVDVIVAILGSNFWKMRKHFRLCFGTWWSGVSFHSFSHKVNLKKYLKLVIQNEILIKIFGVSRVKSKWTGWSDVLVDVFEFW